MVLDKLLSDRTTLVVGSAVMAFDEVSKRRRHKPSFALFILLQNLFTSLLNFYLRFVQNELI